MMSSNAVSRGTDNEEMIERDNEALARRVRQAIEASGMAPADIARRLDVTPQAVNGWMTTGTIGKPKLFQLAELTGYDLGWLVTGRGQLRLKEPMADYVYVPRYQATGGLGRGHHNDQHVEISGTHAYRREWIDENGWNPKALAVINARGPSMSDTINDGDLVLVNLEETTVTSGSVYVIEDAVHGARIKRLHHTLDGRIRVESDNPDKKVYPDDYLTPDSGARVIGRVVHRSGRV